MIEYIYFVKCPNCEDEHFDFFDEAKAFALGCLSQKPIITQIEVCRNDFGECTDSSDLGTIWSWEDECKECGPDAEKAGSHILTKADLENVPERDPEFDNLDNSVEVEDDDFRAVNELAEALKESIAFKDIKDFEEFARLCSEIGLKTLGDVEDFARREQVPAGQLMDKLREYRDELGPDFKIIESRKSVPEGMTIEQLVEEMEENEDEVECTWCNDLFPKDQCRKEVDLGYLCSRCEAAIKSRGEKLTFVENDYWDFLDEEVRDPFDHHDPDYDEDEAADYLANRIDGAKDARYDKAIDDYDFFNEDFDDPVDEEEVEESIFAEAESVEEVAEILIKEEEKAIDQYEEAADKIEELASEEVVEETKEVLDHIKEEEEEHVDELKEFLPEENETSEISNDPEELVEKIDIDTTDLVSSGKVEIWGIEPVADSKYNAILLKSYEDIGYSLDAEQEVFDEMHKVDGLFTFGFTKSGAPELHAWNTEIWRTLSGCEIIFEDPAYDAAIEKAFSKTESLDGTDNAVVDCKVADVITHSKDEKPVDCEGKKKPLEKPLTESAMIDCPECGAKKAFDPESGVCNSCGFII